MRLIKSLILITVTLSGTLLFADATEQSVPMQTANFIPSHPECNKAPRPQIALPVTPKAQPVIVAAAPVEKPVVVSKSPIDSDKDGVIDEIDQCPNTPRGYKVDPVGCPSSVTLHMNFKTGSSVLPKSSEKDIQILTTFMQDNPAAAITIIGHTDNVGKAVYNINLSKARAQALATRMIKNGISEKRVISDGKGLTEPIASNKTKQGRAENRRINIQIR